MTIRDAIPSDATFLAKCVMAGMHFYDFESDIPENIEIYRRLTKYVSPGKFTYTKYPEQFPGSGDPYYYSEVGVRDNYYDVKTN